MSSYRVALVTCASLSELSDDDRPLLLELWRLGIKADPVVWDDPAVDWAGYDLVVIRSAWDYHLNPAAFLAWLSRLEALGVAMWNPAAIIRTNAHKSYLRELESAGVLVVPTIWVPQGGCANLDRLLDARGWSDAVVKPAISAGAIRTSRVKRGDPSDPAGQAALDEVLACSDAMIQQFLPEISTEGEWSFIFLGEEFSHAVLKTPREGDFRVQEGHGGRLERREPSRGLLAQARSAFIAGPRPCLYARVDGVRRGSDLFVMEVELTEPSLYFSLAPGSARRFSGLIREKIK